MADKQWRDDLGLWEQRCVHRTGKLFWEYTFFDNGKINTSRVVNQRRRGTKRYVGYIEPSQIRVGKKEFYSRYSGNKWIVPMNFKLDLNIS